MAHALAEVSSFVAANVRNLSVDGFLRPLNQRIAELACLASEDDEQEAFRPKSLEGFCRFLSLHGERIESRPQLVLTLDGYLRAVWRKGKGHRIALRFIDDKRLVPGRIDIGQRPGRPSVCGPCTELRFPRQTDVLFVFEPFFCLDWHRVRPGHDLVPPLGNEPLRNDDKSPKIRPLVSQGIQDHERLHRLAESHLVSQQVANPHIGEHSKYVCDLVGVYGACNSGRRGERRPHAFEIPSQSLYAQAEVGVRVLPHAAPPGRALSAR